MPVLSFLASCRLVVAGIAAFFDAGASHATRVSSAAGGEVSRRRREENFRISPPAADAGGFSGCGISNHRPARLLLPPVCDVEAALSNGGGDRVSMLFAECDGAAAAARIG
jgi:hypothetical protein